MIRAVTGNDHSNEKISSRVCPRHMFLVTAAISRLSNTNLRLSITIASIRTRTPYLSTSTSQYNPAATRSNSTLTSTQRSFIARLYVRSTSLRRSRAPQPPSVRADHISNPPTCIKHHAHPTGRTIPDSTRSTRSFKIFPKRESSDVRLNSAHSQPAFGYGLESSFRIRTEHALPTTSP